MHNSGFPSRPPPRPSSALPQANFPSQPLPKPPVERNQSNPMELPSIPHSLQQKPLPRPTTTPNFTTNQNCALHSVPLSFPSVPQQVYKPLPNPSFPVVPNRPSGPAPNLPQRPSQPPMGILPRPAHSGQPTGLPPIPTRPNDSPGSLMIRSQTAPIQRKPKENPTTEFVAPSAEKWKIEPLKKMKLSKSNRPEVANELREEFVSQELSKSLLYKLNSPPELAYKFQPSVCFELLHGKLYDANYEFFPQPKPPNRWFDYSVEIILASQYERNQPGKSIGEIRLLRLDHPESYETIPLEGTLPCLELRPRVYMFRSAGPRFFIIELPYNTPPSNLSSLSELLMEFSLLHRMNPKGMYQEVTLANSSAAVINSGGEVLGQGIAKGSAFLGKGLRSASTLYTSKTKKVEKPTERELTEEEIKQKEIAQKRLEGADKASSAFVSGTRGVKLGLKKGFGFVGRTGAQIADGSAKTVKKTDWYQEREAKKLEEKPKDPDKGQSNLSGAVNIAKSTLNAGSSVISGVKQGTRTVAKDVRESTVTIAEHSKGEGAAAKTRQGFNIAGRTALGGAFVFQITAVESWHCVVHTGVGAASYDPDKKEVLAGIAWKVGWMTKQGSFMNPWSPRFAVLRTYSISFYKDPKHSEPSSYIKLDEISKVELVPFSVTEKHFCLCIQTKKEIFHFSLDLGEEISQQLEINRNNLPKEQEAWLNTLTALIAVDKFSKFKKKQAKKNY